MKMSLLEAISPTAAQLLAGGQSVFAVGYTWHDAACGELEGRTVVFACDADAAVQSFRSKHRHLSNAWVIHPPPEPEDPFVTARSFLKKEAA